MSFDNVDRPTVAGNSSPDISALYNALNRDDPEAAKAAPRAASGQEHPGIAFLRALDTTGRHNLVAIYPDGEIESRTFEYGEWAAQDAWVQARDGRCNVYFTANEPRAGASHSSLQKHEIALIRCVYGDADPQDGVSFPVERQRLASLRDELVAGQVPPTFVIDSGGGIQPIWVLDTKLPAETHIQAAEEQGRGIARHIGGDRVQNINRFLRLPGTLNLPKPSKRLRGQVEQRASVSAAGRRWSLDEIAAVIPPAPASREENDARIAEVIGELESSGFDCASTIDDLEPELRTRFERARQDNPALDRLWSGEPPREDSSGSGYRAKLAAFLGRAGGFSAIDYAQLAWVWPYAVQAGDDRETKLTARALARDWCRVGEPADVAQRHFDETVAPAEPVPAQGPTGDAVSDVFPMLSLGDIINRPPQRYAIGRHLPERAVGFLYGDPGTGKSFIALDWALHLAFGKRDWHGDAISVDPTACVIYLAGEGAQGFRMRVLAWMKLHDIPDSEIDGGRFRLIEAGVNMMAPEDVRKLATSIQRGAGKACLLVVDTVSRSMPGADENAQKEMTLFVKACDVLRDAFDCVVLGVHHANRNGAMRGSSVLLGAGDFVFKLERKRGKAVGTLVCEKQKDGPDGWSDDYRLHTVDVSGGSSLVPSRCAAFETQTGAANEELSDQVLDAMQKAWDARSPWGETFRTRDRWAVQRMISDFGFTKEGAEAALTVWLDAGRIELAMFDRRNKQRGYRIVTYNEPTEEPDFQDAEQSDDIFA